MFYPGAGDDLCGGFFFCVWALICDLEHAYKAYDMPCPTANACCALCPLGLIAGVVWFDFRPNAKWLAHIYTVQSWLARGFIIVSNGNIGHTVITMSLALGGLSCNQLFGKLKM
jgi:hypothetical protein